MEAEEVRGLQRDQSLDEIIQEAKELEQLDLSGSLTRALKLREKAAKLLYDAGRFGGYKEQMEMVGEDRARLASIMEGKDMLQLAESLRLFAAEAFAKAGMTHRSEVEKNKAEILFRKANTLKW